MKIRCIFGKHKWVVGATKYDVFCEHCKTPLDFYHISRSRNQR